MKKSKIIALLLAVTMVASMVIFPAQAEETAVPGACAHGCADPQWTVWNGTDVFADGGHYYLTGPVTLEARVAVVGKQVCLDLCGQTVTGAENNEVFRIATGAELTVMDSVGGGKVQAVGTYGAEGGNIYVGNSCKFNLYGGEITGGNAGTDTSTGLGGNIYAGLGAEVNIYGGKVTNGSAYSGGNIYINRGTLNMTGGEVSGGSAEYRGGNIVGKGLSTDYALINISGTAAVGSGTAKNWGVTNGLWANTAYATFNISGDAVINSSVCVPASTNLNIYGGTLKQVEVRAGSVVNMYGGRVDTLSGNAGATVCNGYLGAITASGTVTKPDCTTLTAVGETGKLYSHAAGLCGNATSCGHTYAHTACPTCGQVHEALSATHTAACEKCGEDVTWTMWDGSSIAAGTQAHYFLAYAVNMPSGVSVYNGAKICLDLNGKTLTAGESSRAFTVYSTTGGELSVMDSGANGAGTIRGNGAFTTGNGGLIHVSGTAAVFNLYSGIISGGAADGPDNDRNGGNINVANGTANLYGGTVTGGRSDYRGGNIAVSGTGTLNISGDAKVIGGELYDTTTYNGRVPAEAESPRGGNIYAANGTTVNISGNAEISGGLGGNPAATNLYTVQTTGTTVINMYGGSIINGSVMVNDADVNFYNGVVQSTQWIDSYRQDCACMHIAYDSDPMTFTFAHVAKQTCSHTDIPAEYLEEPIHRYMSGDNAGEAKCRYCGTVQTGMAAITDNVPYAALADALAAAKTDSVVTLLKAAEAGELAVNGYTLDLNGNTLTAAKLDASNVGNVIDNTDGKGKLVTTDALFHANNTMVPVTVEGGYVFEPTGLKEGYYTDSAFQAGNATAKYYVYIDKAAADTALDEALAAGTVKLILNVKWTNADSTTGEKAFELSGEKLAAYVEGFDTKMMLLNLSGLENVTELECNAQLVSNSATVE